ncbi:hypothetical protein ABPG74_014713 [Tetrahymena malaccensis]
MLLQKVLALNDKKLKDSNKNSEESKLQDPFSKAVMHIISKEYYKESIINNVLKNLICDCLKQWDELQKLQQIISDKEDIQKAISQIAETLSEDMQVKSIQRNSPIFFYGDKDEQIYYILKGSVQLFIPKQQKEIWDEVDFNRRLKNASNDQKVLEEKDRFDIVINAIQKMKGSHIDLIKENDKLKKKYFDENYQVSKIKKVQLVKAKQMFGEISYLLEKPRPYTAIASEECYCVIFEPKIYRRALGEYFSFINCKNIYLNNYFSSIRKETIFHLSISFNQEIKLYLGDYLFREGDQGNRIYLLKQGKIEFQKRLGSTSVFYSKRKNLNKLKQKQTQQKGIQKSSFTMQSLTKLTQPDEIDDTQQENLQSFKRSNKKKKTFQIQDQEQPSSQDSLTEFYSSKKTYDQLNVSNFGAQDQMQTVKIASMAQFDEFDKNDTQKESLKQKDNLKQNDKADIQEDLKYKDVSLGIIQQGEFFGFEDILISSQNNNSQNISQNRRTYSAKVVSSDAIVFSIERSTFLKMLSQNEVLDQDIKTKALIKIQYHQQRIDSLKKFEDFKNVNIYQKVPLKEMLKEKYLQMDLRAASQKSQQVSISNLPKLKDLKINLDQIDNSSQQPSSLSQSPQQNLFNIFSKDELIDNIQRQQSLTKSQNMNIKQEKKLIDDIDCFDELNIPKDISKGNVQFLRFHDGQFTDLKSMKQSFIDQEERYKQIKKTKHSVNIADQNQLALARLYQKTNSPSIKNFKNIILKKNTSVAKSNFNKQAAEDNNINNQDEISKKEEAEHQNQIKDDNDTQNSPSHKKLKLILTKNKTLKPIESQPYAKDICLIKNQSFQNSNQESPEKQKAINMSISKVRFQHADSEIENSQNQNLDQDESTEKQQIEQTQTDNKNESKLLLIQKCEETNELSINKEKELDVSKNDESLQNIEEANQNMEIQLISNYNIRANEIQNKKTYQLKLCEILTPRNAKNKQQQEFTQNQVHLDSKNNESIVICESGSINQIGQNQTFNKNSSASKQQFLELPRVLQSDEREQSYQKKQIQNISPFKQQKKPDQLYDGLQSYRDLQIKSTRFQINQNIDSRSKSMNNLEDPTKMGSFSSFLPSLLNFDIKFEQETSQILDNKNNKKSNKQNSQRNVQKSNPDIQLKECQSSQSIYINQYLQKYNNTLQIVNDLKEHLNDKTNSQDVSTYINMRNKSLPSLYQISNQNNQIMNSDSKRSHLELDSRIFSPQKNNIKQEINLSSLNSSPLLEQKKAHQIKLRNFEINLNHNVSHKLELSHPDVKYALSSKSTKKSGDYFKHLFSNPRSKFSIS